MNFDLGPHELALRDGIRELCARRFPIDRVRKGFDRSGWRNLGEAGVFSLRLPESDGGVGLGMTEAAIVFQELGRFLVPGPLVATHVAAGLVDGAATGDRVVALRDGDLVAFGAECDAAIDLTSLSVVSGPLPGDDVTPLDPLTPMRRVSAVAAGETVDASTIRRDATLLTAALSSGIASRTVELAVDYAKQREQFGKPIGTFQAVKHICADMFVRAEVARAAVDAAAVLVDEGADATTAVATAKLMAGEAGVANAKSCIQVYGGMGFTWEVDAQLYLKRAAVLAAELGGADVHEEVVASAL